MKKTIISIAVIAVALVGLIWIARPAPNTSAPATSAGTLSIEDEVQYDFGSISMAAGTVKYSYRVKNTGSEPVVIGKIYTSCMCTTAALSVSGKEFGPYGMPGHGVNPKINQPINPNEEAVVEVVFDPAAHGPAGVGRIQRSVTLEHNAGLPLQFQFAATVTP